MPWLIDAVTLLFLAAFAAWGFQEGLVAQLMKLAAVVVAILGASAGAPALSAWLVGRIGYPALAYPLSYGILLVGLCVLGWILANAVRGRVEATSLKWPDRLSGGLLGVLRGGLLASAVLLALLHGGSHTLRKGVETSHAGPVLLDVLARGQACLSDRDRELLAESKRRLLDQLPVRAP